MIRYFAEKLILSRVPPHEFDPIFDPLFDPLFEFKLDATLVHCTLPPAGLYTMVKRKWDWMQCEKFDFLANAFLAMSVMVSDTSKHARLLLFALHDLNDDDDS